MPFSATFASPGASPLADQTRTLLKDGSVTAISIGFDIKASEPITPGRPRDGVVATKWVLYEVSVCAIPVDPAAVVTQRAHGLGAEIAALHRRWQRLAAQGRPLTAAERAAEAAALAPRPPIYAGDGPAWAAAMRDHLERDALRRSASRYARHDYPVRQAEARALARLAGL